MNEHWHIAAFYQFTRIPDVAGFSQALRERGTALDLRGTVIVAEEGINGTLGGTREGIAEMIAFLRENARFREMDVKYSTSERTPFARFKVREKAEIVAIRHSGADPREGAGVYVEAAEWNALLRDPEVTVIDTRNDYEIEVGRFPCARDPGTGEFNQFPEFVKTRLNPLRNRKVAMYCTGGIRCEKATAFLKQHGFAEVYHLKGGILRYLETVPPEENLWEGECFVFDERVAVDRNLRPTEAWKINPATRKPVRKE